MISFSSHGLVVRCRHVSCQAVAETATQLSLNMHAPRSARCDDVHRVEAACDSLVVRDSGKLRSEPGSNDHGLRAASAAALACRKLLAMRFSFIAQRACVRSATYIHLPS